jgi:cysteine-rich repeat protein
MFVARRSSLVARHWCVRLICGLVLLAPSAGVAGGPLVTTTAGELVGWSTAAPVPYHTDLGALGVLDSASAIATVDGLFMSWQDVSTATIEFGRAGSLPVDVDAGNFVAYLGPYGGAMAPLGQNAIVFDADGTIFDALFGIGTGVLGFAGPTFLSDGVTTVPIGDPVPPGARIVEGLAFLNGKWIDGVSNPFGGNPEISLALFETVFVHEFGHFAGLDHTQIHGVQQPPSSDMPFRTTPVETMFPFLIDTTQATLERDDVVALSVLYPTAGFAAATGRITGQVLDGSGAPLSGVNVVARNVADDSDAVSYVSNATLVQPGAFTLAGLTPGASYRVDIETVDVYFTAGSRVGPFSPPFILPGPPEAWNGAGESDDPAIDDPTVFTPVAAAAGVTVSGIDITVNRQRFGVRNVRLDPGASIVNFAIGDFDGDAIPDFVAPQVGFAPTNLTRFYRGLGGGVFAPGVEIDAFPGNKFVVAGQFNAATDSFLDIALASSTLNDVRVYLGDGGGDFLPPSTALDQPSDPAAALIGLVAGDVDGDAFTDLVTVRYDFATGKATAYALLGNGTGAFGVVSSPLAADTGAPLATLQLAHVAGSPAADVVGISSSFPAEISVLVGNGSGGFSAMRIPIPSIAVSLHVEGIAAADFDHDGKTDLAINDLHPAGGPPNYTRSFIDVLRGDGAGGFTLASRYDVPESFQPSITTGDFDADGHVDIASAGSFGVPGFAGAKATIAFGDGAGGIREETTVWGLAEFPEGIAAGDLDGNGRDDLLISDSRYVTPDPTEVYYSVLLDQSCGDGAPDPGEQCDDGNATDGDGCDRNCTVTACGNGIITAGEQCDDGNTTGGDCCAASCQAEAAGLPCPDDGFLCSRDTCDGLGACAHARTPVAGCRAAGRSRLLLRNSSRPGNDALAWKWVEGVATAAAEFGNPTATTDYGLCIYAGSAAAFVTGVSASADPVRWSSLTRGFLYRDPGRTENGVRRMRLQESIDGRRATLSVRGRGRNLPTPLLGGLPLPVRAQLITSDGPVCWEAAYDSSDVIHNDAEQFKARAP